MPGLYILGGFAAVVGAYVASSALRVVWRRVFRPKAKGHIGESKVKRVLKHFSRRGARGKNDILLEKENGTSQIDHLLITKQGIVVIETKNYSGMISGSRDSRLWTQSFPNSFTEPRQFYNPIMQNNGHIKALKNAIGKYSDVPFHSLVVFSGDCSFPQLPGVVSSRHLKGALRYITSGPSVLSNQQIQDIEKLIDDKTISGRSARSSHNARASLNASAPSWEVQELIQKSLENPVHISTFVPEPIIHPEQNSRRLLTDTHAKLNIRGREKTISAFFEDAKRRNDGQPVTEGGVFDYFICPYTGDRLPASEALGLYQGLWIAYLNKNPELVEFMKQSGDEEFGNTYRCKKVLSEYRKDSDAFIAQARKSAWYQNMAAKQRKKETVDKQIQSAQSRTPTQKNKPVAKSINSR